MPPTRPLREKGFILMLQDLQKASLWKRFSAFLFDFIILVTLVAGIASLLSGLMGYDKHNARLDDIRMEYATKYGIQADITEEEFDKLTEAEKALRQEASMAFAKDEEASYLYSYLFSMSLTMLSLSFLIGFLILELVVPLCLHNGQTLGKKIFGVAVMRRDWVKVSPMILFIRAILCKYTLETMIPVLFILMVYFGTLGLLQGAFVVLGILLLQIALVLSSHTRSAIHDLLSSTVTVDMATQMIFDSVEDKKAYMEKLHAEEAEKALY